jgi:hypothetical protein
MKRSLFILMALLIATPAWAVTITCTHEGSGVVRIDYDRAGEPSKVRAFALDVSVDCDATFTAITDYSGGEGNKYGIFPGTIDLSDLNSPPVWGTPIAPSDDPGASGTGLGTGRVILEMGSLYEPNLAGPPDTGTLCKLTLTAGVDASCTVSIEVETTRGGIVLESGASVDANTSCTVLWPPPGPECWTWPGQCHGDCDGNDLKVNIDDFYPFKDSYGSNYPDADYFECADFDRDGDVDIDDFYIFKDSYIVTDVPGDCTPGGTWPPS